MKKSSLIEKLTLKYPQYATGDITSAINKLINLMADSLANGKRIEIRGFGSFSLHFQAARTAHNPKTGEKIATKNKYRPHFKPGKELRARVNPSINEK